MLGALLLAVTALAVDPAPPTAPGAPGLPTAPSELPPALVPLRPAPLHDTEGWVEERGTTRFAGQLVSLARAADGSAWLLVLDDGTILRSIDGARTWSRVLRGTSADEALDDEALLLEGERLAAESVEVESAGAAESLDESTNDAPIESSTADEAPTGDEAASAPPPVDDASVAELSDVDALAELQQVDAPRGNVAWFHPTDPTLALVGRDDGLWRSTDAGIHFERVDAEADATCFLAVPGGILLAGTGSGLRVSPDGGERWIDAVDATDGRRVHGLAEAGGTVYAASAGGLYASTDTLRWRRLGELGATAAVLPDPGWAGGLWVATERGVYRSDDGGLSFAAMGRPALRGVRGLAGLGLQGHVLAWGIDGAWESTDGGVTWHALSYGLRDPEVRALVVVDDRPIAVTARAVWRLRPTRLGGPRVGPGADRLVSARRQVELGELVRAGTQRAGLRIDVVDSMQWRPLIPTLTVSAGAWNGYGRKAAFLTGQNEEDNTWVWAATVKLCFGGCVSLLDSVEYEVASSDGSSYDSDEVEAAYEDDADAVVDSLYVVGGEVLSDGSEPIAAVNVSQRIRNYRFSVADQIVSAWTALQRLEASGAPESLAGAVDYMLQLEELRARLDLYTDGAYSRAQLAESP